MEHLTTEQLRSRCAIAQRSVWRAHQPPLHLYVRLPVPQKGKQGTCLGSQYVPATKGLRSPPAKCRREESLTLQNNPPITVTVTKTSFRIHQSQHPQSLCTMYSPQQQALRVLGSRTSSTTIRMFPSSQAIVCPTHGAGAS